MFNRLRHTSIPDSLRWAVLAWALLFACSQSLAIGHIHFDNSSDEACLVCVHAQNTPATGVGGPVSLPAADSCRSCAAADDRWLQLAPPSSYLTRAPPQA